MKTSHTLTTWDNETMAAGFDSGLSESRRAAIVPQPEARILSEGQDNVIDLAAWRAANLEDGEMEEAVDGFDWEDEEEPAVDIPAPRSHWSHDRAVAAAELVSTLCVVVVAVVLILRVLTF